MKMSVSAVLLLAICAALGLGTATESMAEQSQNDLLRGKADKIFSDGNAKEALDIYLKLAGDPAENPMAVDHDLRQAISALNQLNRSKENDSVRETIIGVHSNNWRLLRAAGQSYYSEQHYGTIIAGQFERGNHRGGDGKWVSSFARDRIRAIQLAVMAMEQADKNNKDANPTEVAGMYIEFARMVMGYSGYGEAWRLQYLTDLSTLPDYEEGARHGYYGGSDTRAAPVDAEGNPVFHKLPKSWTDASSDGERWRWLLQRAAEIDPSQQNRSTLQLANFSLQQFDVQTMASYPQLFGRGSDTKEKDEGGPFAVSTLAEDETLARLATGIKRFKLPDEFNFIKLYQQIADNSAKGGGFAEEALRRLAESFENRRQYDRAVEIWRRSIKLCGEGSNHWKQNRIDQILNNWGRFEGVGSFPAGKDATVEFRFRNGKKATFTAEEIHLATLLDDIKSYIRSDPSRLDWQRINIANIGWLLIQKQNSKYVGGEVAKWDIQLQPREKHFDTRTTIKTPLSKAGAYMLTAKMEDGNTSKIVIWINDTAIVKKHLDKQTFFFVADAVTGAPLEGVNLEFFGYRQQWRELSKRNDIITTDFAENSDANGQVLPSRKDLHSDYQWLITATSQSKKGEKSPGRLAYLGFTGIWYPDYYDHEYNESKVFTVTDRPVYRPNQVAKFKLWVRHAKYDQEDTSSFAGQSFQLRIYNPKGDSVFESTFKADEFGGFDGEYPLPDEAPLGSYSIAIVNRGDVHGGGSFRVEEYKKPEFEVTVEAPTDPVMLGETVTATLKAKYYFGAPVTEAKVKYKVSRSSYSANWYPVAYWDWFYGPGYWWFAYDYDWYPGWHQWGCRRPSPWWWPVSRQPPEIVAQAEVPVGPDGTIKVQIDTAIAKAIHGDQDHRYEITAEVTDNSRRTIVGQGTVLVARKPFKVYAWVDKGHYRVGDVVQAGFSAQTLDNKPVKGAGEARLFTLSYKNDKDGVPQPVEKLAREWKLDTDETGAAQLQINASKAGQYRLAYTVTDEKKHSIEGAYVFCVMGEPFDGAQGRGDDGKNFKFNSIELVQDKKEYHPGEKVRLMVNTDRPDSSVILFVRPANGIYLPPEIIKISGKSVLREIEITKRDMPNFFVEAITISDGQIYTDTKEIIVPPEKRVLNLEVVPSAETYKPGEKASVKVRLTDIAGKPYVGTTVMTVYDKAVEYISGGSNIPEIKAFFWKWRRQHHTQTESSLERYFANLVLPSDVVMQDVGTFGHDIQETALGTKAFSKSLGDVDGFARRTKSSSEAIAQSAIGGAEMEMLVESPVDQPSAERKNDAEGAPSAEPSEAQPTVRKNFADTAFWIARLDTDKDGIATVAFQMPESLTTWRMKTWAMGHGTVVGEAAVDVVTTKNLLLRLQAPRFFVEKDEVVLSANIHNYLKQAKRVKAVLEFDGGCIESIDPTTQTVEIDAAGEKRVDWRVKVLKEGEAVVRMKALTDEESDAMEMRFPVYVHGMSKTESYCGVIRPEKNAASFSINVPLERRIEESVLEMRYSPTLAGAMVDALPYMVEYPYGCTEQTLNRFLPTVITQKILKDMGLNLKQIQEKRTNLNAQEIGDDAKRSEDWKRVSGNFTWDGSKWVDRNPVFDDATVADMVRQGLKALTAMQLDDGGWGWFSGWGEQSYAHTTAYVVHGLQIAQQNGVALVPGVLDRGVRWLEAYQQEELHLLRNYAKDKSPSKPLADNMDAFVFMILVDAGKDSSEMRDFLYRDRASLSVYAKAMFGLALQRTGQKEKLAMIMRNIEQFLVQDDENQTAYLNLGNEGYWWYWYGSENEAHAYYLKLLCLTEPGSDRSSRMVKYLLNNRKHGTYWNSTRDTSLCIEALADYFRASGEDKPDMTIEVFIDGEKAKEVTINSDNIFSFDNKLVLKGDSVKSGKHSIEVRRKGKGPVYFNAYLTNFTLEDFITKAGLEVKVNRKFHKLIPVDTTVKVSGSRGQALDQKVEKFERKEIANTDTLKSGDLVEIELEIDSKNDYEYLVFEDMKAAGFEPVEVRSGYNGNDLNAYVEFRDERVCFFARTLARGKHSVSYRLRAEIPGKFSALPARASAMYAPELKANSDELKVSIED